MVRHKLEEKYDKLMLHHFPLFLVFPYRHDNMVALLVACQTVACGTTLNMF